MRILKKLNLLENTSIKVLLTGDEESSGRPLSLSKKAIVDGAIWADIALGFENGDNNINTGMASRRGYTGWTLNVEGKPAHSSQIFNDDIGYGAIYETARILEAFRAQLEQEENLTFNPGMIIGGTSIDFDTAKSSGSAFGKSNVIAQKAKVKGDLRALSKNQLKSAKLTMQKIVKNNLNHTQAELIFSAGYPPMSLTQGNLDLLAQYSQVSQDLGYNVVKAANPRKAGAADISFAAEHVDMSLDGLGLMGSGAHTKNEIADLTTLNKNIEKTAILIYRLAKLKS
jgi:glutamate carboxypeptidase